MDTHPTRPNTSPAVAGAASPATGGAGDDTTRTGRHGGDRSRSPHYDVVVVGGGAAGLSGALTLARSRRSVLVIDDGTPRNAPAAHVHNYLGREGTPPAELYAIGRDEVACYGGEVVSDRVTGVEPLEAGGFVVQRRDGATVEARRLLVTTGLVDELPAVEGLADHWGSDVLHCPYCHGWEVRDHALAVLGTSSMAVFQALHWRQWTADLTLVLHDVDDPDEADAAKLAALGVEVVRGPVAAVEGERSDLCGLRLADGRLVPCRHVVVAPRFVARGELLDRLGLEPADFVVGEQVLGTHVPADPVGATTVPGVWVAGNVADPTATVIAAAAAGQRAGHAINMSLITEAAEAAVAAAKASQVVAAAGS